MTQSEYNKALKKLNKKRQIDLLSYFEAVITVKGHAWCMDVKSERKKMAKLFMTIYGEINQL